jgi:kumamolisin
MGSNSMRMVPDVSFDANPSTGYPIYVTYPNQSGAWYAFGGTSAAAPSWAAFTAMVNQGRVAAGAARLGFANPSLYQVAKSNQYSSAFHDIADNTTNLHYPAVSGYDLSTGWGSMIAPGLYSALETGALPPLAPGSLTLTSAATTLTLNWSSAGSATSYDVFRSSTGTSGSFTEIASGLTGTTYVDNSASGEVYYYVVAVNSYGASGPSPVESGAINQTAPSTPTDLTATVIQ